MKTVSPVDITIEVETLYQHGLQAGESMGWRDFDELMTMKLGTTFYIYGVPTSGKSEFWLEVMVNTSCLYNWKHVIFSPETGQAKDITAELISKKYRKPFYKNIPGCITPKELDEGIKWVGDHFRIFDQDDGLDSVDGFFKLVDDCELDGFRPHTTLIDPWNELKHDLSKHGGRQDLYLEDALGLVRRNATQRRRINCLITHIQGQEILTKDGHRHSPPPTAREIAGGEAWYRKGMNMIGVWRPPAGMKNDEGIPYEENEAHITVHKYKPKGIGKKGKQVFYYDFKTNSYLIKTKPYGSKLESIRTKPSGHKSAGNEAILRPNAEHSPAVERPPF